MAERRGRESSEGGRERLKHPNWKVVQLATKNFLAKISHSSRKYFAAFPCDRDVCQLPLGPEAALQSAPGRAEGGHVFLFGALC